MIESLMMRCRRLEAQQRALGLEGLLWSLLSLLLRHAVC